MGITILDFPLSGSLLSSRVEGKARFQEIEGNFKTLVGSRRDDFTSRSLYGIENIALICKYVHKKEQLNPLDRPSMRFTDLHVQFIWALWLGTHKYLISCRESGTTRTITSLRRNLQCALIESYGANTYLFLIRQYIRIALDRTTHQRSS